MPDAVSATLKQLRHRPAPPPGHPTPVSYGWPGGGAGRRRFSKADKDSNQARRVCQRADLPAASRKIGRDHVLTPVTNAQLVCRLLLEKKQHPIYLRITKTQ